MTTRDMIEAVREPERFMGSTSVNGTRYARQCVNASDYDALRAATVAVLDEAIKNCSGCGGTGTYQWTNRGNKCGHCANARALREKLR